MPYCPSCGSPNQQDSQYCHRCGQPLNNPNTPDNFFLAQERSIRRRRAERNNIVGSNESLQFFTGIVAIVAALNGLSLIFNPIQTLLSGPVTLLLFAGIIAGAIFRTIFDTRLQVSPLRSLTQTVITGSITYLLIYGIFWLLSNNT